MRFFHPSTTAGYRLCGLQGVAGLLLLAAVSAAPLGASVPGSDGAERLPAAKSAGPRASSRLTAGVARRLDEAFGLALERVKANPTCRELFDPLARDASSALERGLFVAASGQQEIRLCRRGVSAFTEVGSAVTYLCRSFGRLAPRQAALRLVHEALHQAGLPEAPASPTALASVQINELVARDCRL